MAKGAAVTKKVNVAFKFLNAVVKKWHVLAAEMKNTTKPAVVTAGKRKVKCKLHRSVQG